jgi:hypothetical protein
VSGGRSTLSEEAAAGSGESTAARGGARAGAVGSIPSATERRERRGGEDERETKMSMESDHEPPSVQRQTSCVQRCDRIQETTAVLRWVVIPSSGAQVSSAGHRRPAGRFARALREAEIACDHVEG